VVVVLSVPNRYGIGLSIGLFFFLRKMLQEMAKDDPRLIEVHHNSQRYNRGFWTAKPIRAKRWRT
jgi:type IV secretory pathway TrbD component